jgi:hypothetical protein
VSIANACLLVIRVLENSGLNKAPGMAALPALVIGLVLAGAGALQVEGQLL